MRRVKWGIGAAVVVGLAWLVSNFFNMGGLGTGEGTQVGLPVQKPVPTAPSTRTEPPPQEEPPSETATVATQGGEPSIGEGGVIEVLIDDRDYFLRRGTAENAEWVSADIDAIAGYARQATGDEAGVRVRIFRRPAAKALPEHELMEALRNVGVTDAQIDVPDKLVE